MKSHLHSALELQFEDLQVQGLNDFAGLHVIGSREKENDV